MVSAPSETSVPPVHGGTGILGQLGKLVTGCTVVFEIDGHKRINAAFVPVPKYPVAESDGKAPIAISDFCNASTALPLFPILKDGTLEHEKKLLACAEFEDGDIAGCATEL